MPHFAGKWFQLFHSKTWKKRKNALFKRSEDSFLSSTLLKNHFLRRLLGPSLDLNSFGCFISLHQKTVSTLLLKYLQKTEKWCFRRFTTFAFDLNVALKPSNLKTFDFLPYVSHLPPLVAEKFENCEKCDFETLWKLNSF